MDEDAEGTLLSTKGKGEWAATDSFDPLDDPEERQVIFAALDSFQ